MNFGFSDDQHDLRSNVAAVLAAECPPGLVRESVDDEERWRPLWKTVVDLGWPALAVPESAGGLGLGVVDLVALLEVAGGHAVPAPLTSTAGLAVGFLRSAPEATGVLGEIAEGAVATLMAQPAGADVPGPCLRWTGERVRGTAAQVPDATRASVFAVVAEGPQGPVGAVLRAGKGVDVQPTHSVDATRPLANVVVDATPERVWPVSMPRAVAVPLTALAAELVGLAQRVLDLSVAHCLARRQFDRPIGAFQAVKHRLADVYVGLERARTLTYHAAMRLADERTPPSVGWAGAIMAKAAAGDAASSAALAGVQVHGAIAMTWEHDLHLYLRRAWQGSALLGTSARLHAEVGGAYLAGEL